jgi:hypothetical protein
LVFANEKCCDVSNIKCLVVYMFACGIGVIPSTTFITQCKVVQWIFYEMHYITIKYTFSKFWNNTLHFSFAKTNDGRLY